MWIKHTGIPAGNSTRALRNAHTNGERVVFSADSGSAQVTKEVGEQLIDWHPEIVPADGGGEGDDADHTDTDEE